MKRVILQVIVAIVFGMVIGAPVVADEQFRIRRVWQTDPVFQTPEAVLYDAKRDVLYVGNYKHTDPNLSSDFLSKVDTSGKVLDLQWVTGLTGPTGMAIFQDRLYVVERNNLVCIDMDEGRILQRTPIEGAVFCNDVTFDAQGRAYISDNGKDPQTAVFRWENGRVQPWLSSEKVLRPNGLLAEGDSLVTYDNRRKALVRIDLATQAIEEIASIPGPGRAIGDGLIKLDGEHYLVTAWSGPSWIVKTDGTATALLDTQTIAPIKGKQVNHADVGYVPQKKLWVIPAFLDHRLLAYELILPSSEKPVLAEKRVALIIGEADFRDEELLEPQAILEEAGAEVMVVSTTLDTVTGMLGAQVKPDGLLRDLKVETFDAIVFVGGLGARQYFHDNTALRIAKEAHSQKKVLAAICIAPNILANAGLLKGLKATCWPGQDNPYNLKQQGAEYTGNDVEQSGLVITGSGPSAATAFGQRIKQMLASQAVCNTETSHAKTLPIPPEPQPFGQKQPVFGAADGYFTFDGKPAVIISGSIHYPRVPRPYWRDRIKKAKAMGFNCIGTYLFWNAHEKQPGQFDFTGNLDVAAFVKTCQEEGMWVIVRPGPYICAEWDFGAMPAWLLKEADMQVRTNDPRFLAATARYMKAVGRELAGLQINHGGPIIQVQVENEYGQFGRPGNPEDMAYNRAIYDHLVDAGFDTMFIRCDWPVASTVDTAHIEGVYPTMNFGGSADNAFAFFDNKYPGMPKMCGEYWVGWFDHWGTRHHTKALAPFIREIEWMLDNEVSFNVYMVHGGTNWGFTSGANWSGQYSADTTSYDYDAPLDETGRITPKFYTFRKTISQYLPQDHVLPEPPVQIKRITIPSFTLKATAGFEQLRRKPFACEQPTYMEALDQTQGLALYSTTLDVPQAGSYTLRFSALKDRAIIMVAGKRVATLDRRQVQDTTELSLPAGQVTLDILLENMGHLNYSRELLHDRKGLGKVTLNDKEVLNWKIYSFPLTEHDVTDLDFSDTPQADSPLPVFYRGEFTVHDVGDTLLDMRGWGKGMVWVNGINLGRFWDIGPQYTLFMPGCWMKQGANDVIVMDIEPTEHHTIQGVTEPLYGLKIDSNLKRHRQPGETIELAADQIIAEGQFANGDQAQLVDIGKTVNARYVCIESLSSHTNDSHASIAEIHLLNAQGERLDRNRWQVIYADSEELIAEPAGADNIIDEQPVTIWHTEYEGGGSEHPHQIVIDLGAVQAFRTLRYLPRNGANPGKIKDYRIYGSQERFRGLQDASFKQPPSSAENEGQFTPGAVWLDQDGQMINAHGGGLLYHQGKYYWYGEMKSGKTYLPDCNKHWGGTRVDVTGISCYSSEDLLHWRFEGKALDAVKENEQHDMHVSRVVERPKVIYNRKTDKFVLWFHADSMNYAKAGCGVAVSDTPAGPFSYIGSIRPNAGQWPIGYTPSPKDRNETFYTQRDGGQMSRDMTLFVDEDDKAYLFYSSEHNATLHITQLSDDYLSTAGPYRRVFVGRSMEAPAVFKRKDKYYLIASGCTAWKPNAARSAVADNIWGPWRELGNPCRGEHAGKTFFSQSTYVQPVQGQQDKYIFMADRWNEKDLPDSRYIWLPLHFDDQDRPILQWYDQWEL